MNRYEVEVSPDKRVRNILVGMVTGIDFEPQPGGNEKMTLFLIEGDLIEGDAKFHKDLMRAAGQPAGSGDTIIHLQFGGLSQGVLIYFRQSTSFRRTTFIVGYTAPDPTNPAFEALHELLTTALHEEYRGESTSVGFRYDTPDGLAEMTLRGDIVL